MQAPFCFATPGAVFTRAVLVKRASCLSYRRLPNSEHLQYRSRHCTKPIARANKTCDAREAKESTGSKASTRKSRNAQKLFPLSCQYPAGEGPMAGYLHAVLNHPTTEIVAAFLVLGTCLVFALQTLNFTGLTENLLWGYERAVSSLFAVEYFLRWYSVGLKPRFLLTRCMIIDFCAVLLPLALSLAFYPRQDPFEGLFVRSLRFARVFQLQRLLEEEELKNIFGDVSESKARIGNVVLTVFTILYISAGLFHDCEKDVNPAAASMFSAFYWAVNTLFTVGPGDIVPITSLGRVVSVATVLAGAVLIPLQLSEIVAATMQARTESKATAGNDVGEPRKARAVPSSATLDPTDSLTFAQQSLPQVTRRTVGRDDVDTVFDSNAECMTCHLRVHQRDARYCRNCGSRLEREDS